MVTSWRIRSFRERTCPFLAKIFPGEPNMSVPATKHFWRGLAIASAIVFAYATVLIKLSRDWWYDENYSHGLLIPFIIGYIVWLQRDKFAEAKTSPWTLLGGAAVVCGLLGLWAGVAGAELYTQRLSLILLLVGTVLYFWGFAFLRLLLVPFGLLLLAMPIPAIVFNKIAFPLQLFASKCAVWSMSTIGIPVLRQGNVIELKPLNSLDTRKLEVVEACSGIRSLMTLITLAVVFAYFTHPREEDPAKRSVWYKSYGFWRSTILVLSAVPIAILTNAGRVSGTGILSHYYGTQVADGFFHSFSGWAIYIVAFLLLFAVGWILDRFKPKSLKEKKGDTQPVVRENVATPAPAMTVEGNES
jgi:exosortase